MKASAWIDRIKVLKNLPSDYAAAKELGISRGLVSKYRGPTPTFDEEMAVKVAHVLDINPAVILADQAMERAKGQEAKNAWLTVLEKLGGVAVSVLLTAGMLGAIGWTPDAKAIQRSQIPSKTPVDSIYIVSSRTRKKRRSRRPNWAFNPACLS
jgi:hypothetical protein